MNNQKHGDDMSDNLVVNNLELIPALGDWDLCIVVQFFKCYFEDSDEVKYFIIRYDWNYYGESLSKKMSAPVCSCISNSNHDDNCVGVEKVTFEEYVANNNNKTSPFYQRLSDSNRRNFTVFEYYFDGAYSDTPDSKNEIKINYGG